MARLTAFAFVSIDGYFTDRHGDMSFAKGRPDPEFEAYTAQNAKGGGRLVFGRVTYEMMAAWWQTPAAAAAQPAVAERMNALPKIVFSRSLRSVDWRNATLAGGDLALTVARLKADGGDDLVILGSGSLVAQLAAAGLVDALELVTIPVALGGGRTLFDGIARPLDFEPAATRRFGNGNVLVTWVPRR